MTICVEANDITNWFDITKTRHLEAYRHLQYKGFWPEGFIPKNIVFNPVWNTIMTYKLANAYIDEKLTSIILYKNGEPCTHPGCLGHLLHPCETCGRFCAEGDVFEDGVKHNNIDLLWCLKEIMKELPTKRDWLNPNLEKIIKETIKEVEGDEPK